MPLEKLAVPTPMEWAIGRHETSIVNSYELLARIGGGGSGVVYRARKFGTSALVAVKVLRHDLLPLHSERQEFEIEVARVTSIRHANIIHGLETGVTTDGRPFVAMELAHATLRGLLNEPHGLNAQDRLEIVTDVCAALTHLHVTAGLMHRDVKPENILLVRTGASYEVKLGDLGLAHRLTASLSRRGSDPYMAPEPDPENPGLPGSGDVYSLAVVATEVFTGRRPRPHERDDGPWRRTLPPSVGKVLQTAMSDIASDRPSASEFASELRAAFSGHHNSPWPTAFREASKAGIRAFRQELQIHRHTTRSSGPGESPSGPTATKGHQ